MISPQLSGDIVRLFVVVAASLDTALNAIVLPLFRVRLTVGIVSMGAHGFHAPDQLTCAWFVNMGKGAASLTDGLNYEVQRGR